VQTAEHGGGATVLKVERSDRKNRPATTCCVSGKQDSTVFIIVMTSKRLHSPIEITTVHACMRYYLGETVVYKTVPKFHSLELLKI